MGAIDLQVAAYLLDLPSAFDPLCIVDDSTPLWDCPCRECWKLEMDLNKTLGGPQVTYSSWKGERT